MANIPVGYPAIILLSDNPLQNPFRTVRLQRNCDIGPIIEKSDEDSRKMARGETWEAGNSDVSPGAFRQIPAQVVQVFQTFKNPSDLSPKITRIAGRLESAAATFEQLKPGRVGKIRNQPANGGL